MSIFCGIHTNSFKYSSLEQTESGTEPENEAEELDIADPRDILLTLSPVLKPSKVSFNQIIPSFDVALIFSALLSRTICDFTAVKYQ